MIQQLEEAPLGSRWFAAMRMENLGHNLMLVGAMASSMALGYQRGRRHERTSGFDEAPTPRRSHVFG